MYSPEKIALGVAKLKELGCFAACEAFPIPTSWDTKIPCCDAFKLQLTLDIDYEDAGEAPEAVCIKTEIMDAVFPNNAATCGTYAKYLCQLMKHVSTRVVKRGRDADGDDEKDTDMENKKIDSSGNQINRHGSFAKGSPNYLVLRDWLKACPDDDWLATASSSEDDDYARLLFCYSLDLSTDVVQSRAETMRKHFNSQAGFVLIQMVDDITKCDYTNPWAGGRGCICLQVRPLGFRDFTAEERVAVFHKP